jgi:glycosyltransferase involved in cell wall biosynthesis
VSTDGSGAIAERHAARDARIRLVRTDRLLGQLQNYSFAVSQASPESQYVKMVQADDWIFPQCLRRMTQVASEHPSIGVVSSHVQYQSSDYAPVVPPREFFSGRDAGRLYLMTGSFPFGSPTTVMYRADLVRARKPFFEDGRAHPDTEAVLDLLGRSDFGFIDEKLSFTRQQEDSVTGRRRDWMPNELELIIHLNLFGSRYLTEDERDRRLRETTDGYYQNLARRWLRQRVRGRDRAFWEYHRKGLAHAGERLHWTRVAREVAALTGGFLRRPGRLVRRILQGEGS